MTSWSYSLRASWSFLLYLTAVIVYIDIWLCMHHYVQGVDTLTAYSWVVVVSSQCYYIPVQFQLFSYFEARRPDLWERVSYI